MDFFEHQDRARKQTHVLIFYLGSAVCAIVAAVYFLAVAVIKMAMEDYGHHLKGWWDVKIFLWVTGLTVSVIVIGSLYKILLLKQGGSVVATMLGGKPVNLNTSDPDERKLLHVVEEMSLASGTPVPEVYLLDGDLGINAFAAGHDTSDMVIGVTKGCIDVMNRDELQGIIAHEFSHILNGDMRLNIRLMGILHGILCIALVGYTLVRSLTHSNQSSQKNQKGGGVIALLFLGLALMGIGYIGVFFAKLIKSAVSRQREYLADASAVQFTRNPGGIAGALKKIGGLIYGSKINSNKAEEASHLFFANGLGKVWFAGMMATHPPLEERIAAIDPEFDGTFPKVELKTSSIETPSLGEKTPDIAYTTERILPPVAPLGGMPPVAPLITAADLINTTGTPTEKHLDYAKALKNSIPEALIKALRETFGAKALIYGLLLGKPGSQERETQWNALKTSEDDAVLKELEKLLEKLDSLSPMARLPLIDLTLPALRQLSPTQYESFSKHVKILVEADQSINLFEYVLQNILKRHLDPHFGKMKKNNTRFHSLLQLKDDISIVLSVLANLETKKENRREVFLSGVSQLNVSNRESFTLLEASQLNLNSLDRALNRLAEAAPFIKKNLLYASATIVLFDRKIDLKEIEILRAMADILECPIPPFLMEEYKESLT